MKIVLSGLLLFTSFLQAHNGTEILGKVLDENEQPISGAKITNNELSLAVFSDEKGFLKKTNEMVCR